MHLHQLISSTRSQLGLRFNMITTPSKMAMSGFLNHVKTVAGGT
nr:MAG TPA: hypothetical protein [Caudoviricetes sp.]